MHLLSSSSAQHSSVVPQGAALATGACAAALALAGPTTGFLRWLGAGKTIRPDLPHSHQIKSGTPTMAGLLFDGVTLVLNAVFVAPRYPRVWLLLLLLLAASVIGLVDDLLGSSRYQGEGLTVYVKLGLLALVAGVVVALAQLTLHLHSIQVPFAGTLDLGLLYWPVGVFIIVGTSNAVNLTDGLDGLAGGTGAIAVAAYAVIALARGQDGVALCLLALTGALLGFLWFNVHPARFFMGDSGALAVGAVLAGASLLTGDVLVLPVIGAVFVAVTLSVIGQVGFYKLSGGRRLFRKAPLHHHLEVGGWPETQVVLRFWLAGALAALIGVGLALT